jgi:GTPase involved in cell partitioning and DNA repair
MNKIKELTAHIRRLAEKGYIVDYNTPNELNNALNQIEVVSELMNEVEMKLKEPNFYIVNSKKYLTDEQRNSVAEKITQMSTTSTWIEIKSAGDLPKEEGYYWVINSFDDIFIEDFSPKDIIDKDIWLDHRTHYQPIHKPQQPNKLH